MRAKTLCGSIAAAGCLSIFAAGIFAIDAQAQQRVASDVRLVDVANVVMARPVSVKLDRVPLRQAVDRIAASANVRVVYQDAVLDESGASVSVNADKQPLGTVFATILQGTPLRAVATGPDIVSIAETEPVAVRSQTGVIVGRVVDARTKRPIANANIALNDATKGAVTGEDGTYRLPAPEGKHVVRVRALGFSPTSSPVTLGAEQTVTVDFALEPSANVLSEIVVTGSIVETERKSITTPITVITADDIERRNITRVEQLFRGDIPGVIALETGSQMYSIGAADSLGGTVTSQMYARSTSSLDGSANPLKTFVDGVEILDPSYLGTIDPKNIERIEVLTGPQATTLYGAGALGGVMQIFTKRGSETGAPEFTANLQTGWLQNNISDGLTPSHNHTMSVQGGSGPEFSYTGTLGYNYSGQWQPNLFNRTYNMTVGGTYRTDKFTASGSVGVGSGKSGTALIAPFNRELRMEGEYSVNSQVGQETGRENTWSSQLLSLNLDYRATSWWQHHLTVGRDQKDFVMVPHAPHFRSAPDSLYRHANTNGSRVSFNYHMTFSPQPVNIFSPTLILGASGSTADRLNVRGCTPSKSSTSFIACYLGPLAVTTPFTDESWGGFGNFRMGVWDQLFFTLGLRGETNPAYGRDHKIDWTPTTGLAYTYEQGEMAVKFLVSYGSATRSPLPDQRDEVRSLPLNPRVPFEYVSQEANDQLTPEYSRGPQYGIEFYYGRWGSFTVGHYNQRVKSLIQPVYIDSIAYENTAGNTAYARTRQFMNVGDMRQIGWDGTGRLNVGPMTLSGTYSWMDGRVISVREQGLGVYQFYKGMSFALVPTHTGNVTVGYSHGGTTVSLINRFISQTTQLGNSSPYTYEVNLSRISAYASRARTLGAMQWRSPGYSKSDLLMSQRVAPWATVRLNIVNIGDSHGGDADSFFWPSIGRQTMLGVSMRFPR